ncbi:MAG: glutaredoxin [Alphaproteobacteria bacterium]|jgi:glutaredoxin 3|nr:glutaredoxin [Alphaproteobacteria bacterium]MBT7942536.1 glutaredoxin [Alphaproteobacteria bacterium]
MKPEATIEIYYKTWCSYSRAALALLDDLGVAYTGIDVTSDPEREAEMVRRSGRTTVPEIFIHNELIGGYDDLRAFVDLGALDSRMAA